MSVFVIKSANVDVLCPIDVQNTINADASITANCISVTVNDGTDLTIEFDVALSPAEDTALTNLVDAWDNSLCGTTTTTGGTDPQGNDFSSGLAILNDDDLLVADTEFINFKGSVAATTDSPGKADVYINAYEVINADTKDLIRATPVYAQGTDPVTGLVQVIEADASDPNRMPALGVLETDIPMGGTGLVIFSGELKNVNTENFNEGDEVWVASGGWGTNVRPSGNGVLVQKIAQILKADPVGNTGSAMIFGAGRSNDVPNIPTDYVWVGDANEVASPRPYKLTELSDTPVTPADGDTLVYDSTTNTWISKPVGTAFNLSHQMVFSEQGTAKNEWLELYGDSRYSNTMLGVMPFKSKLVGITFTNRDKNARGEIRVYSTPEGGGNSPKTLDLSWIITDLRTARKTIFTNDIIFDAGDKIAVYMADRSGGANPSYPVVVLYFVAIDDTATDGGDNWSGDFKESTGGGSK